MRAAALPILLLLAACAAPRPTPSATAATPGSRGQGWTPTSSVPDYASRPDEPFSRVNAVAIAMREWRAFGMLVDDDPPDTRPPQGEGRPDRQPGLWERVGDYWFMGQHTGQPQQQWSSKYDEWGNPLPPGSDSHAWSAAFISYVMRAAGAGPRFPYAPDHAQYIDAAVTGGYALTAHRPTGYAPLPGDLICMGRDAAANMTFSRLPAPIFPGHCDMVVATEPGQLTVVGGNVDGAVTMKHVPVTPDGKLATPDGTILDTRWPWFVVLQVLYDQ